VAGFVDRRWASRDGLQLYARDYPGAAGEARLPVVCLHGLTRSSKDFDEVAERIAATGRRILAPDARGRGRSAHDPDPSNYKPPVYARDVLALLDSLGIARAVFLGTSMGGIVIMTLAALRRRAIAAAILNDVGPEVGREGVDRILSYAGKPAPLDSWDDAVAYVRRVNGSVFPDYSDDEWRRLARRTFRDESGKPAFDYDPAIVTPLGKGPVKTRSLAARLLFRRLAKGRPVLLIRGERSDLMTDGIAAKMKRMAPRMEEMVVPNVGHAPMLTEPEAAEAIDRFLAMVR